MSARVLVHPPHDDPRSTEYQSKKKQSNVSSSKSGQKITYPLTLVGRKTFGSRKGSLQQQQQYTTPDVVWQAPPLFDRRNYGVLRIFQGGISERPGVSKPDGDSSLSKHVMDVHACRIETELVPSHTGVDPRLTLGPIIGRITSGSVVIMVEIDNDGVIECVCRDVLSGATRVARLCTGGGESGVVRGNRPHVFLAEHLCPGRKYSVFFRGVSNGGTDRRGSFVTLPERRTASGDGSDDSCSAGACYGLF
jgi:hypothetical protein